MLKAKGYDLLLLTEDVDEFAIQMLRNYDEKEFRNISGGDLGLESEEEKEEIAKQNEDKLKRFGLLEKFGESAFFPTVGSAVSHYLQRYPVEHREGNDLDLE